MRPGPAAALAVAVLALASPRAEGHVALRDAGASWLVGSPAALGHLPIGGSTAGVREASGSATPAAYGDCGPDARPEPGLQGQVPRAEQESGDSADGYRCNLRRAGHHDLGRRGANFQLAWYRDCAYVGIVGNQVFQTEPGPPEHPLDGVAVLDAGDPARPELVRVVQSAVGRTQHEAIEVNARRGILVVATGGLQARWIELYDISADCREPVFRGRYDASRPLYHGLDVSDDGRTVYATDNYGVSGSLGAEMLHVIDIDDLSAPRLLAAWDPTEEGSTPYAIHDLELSADGNRAYLGAQPPSSNQGIVVAGPPSNAGEPSLVVLDTSDIQARRPDPDLRIVGEVSLPNFGHAVQRATIGGRPYLFSSGESVGARAENCPWAWGHVLDMSDETNPKPVADLRLEVNEPAHCEDTGRDGAVYSIHYVGVDDEQDTTRVFYSYYSGGLRVFDVSEPASPREVAYYHPPPGPDTVFPPGEYELGDKHTPAWDSVASNVRYRPDQGHAWIASIRSGFHVLELTGSARPAISRRSGCRRKRHVTIRLRSRLRRGERITRARARVNASRVRAERRGRTRVRMKLPVRGQQRRRLRLVVRTSAGRRIVVRRSFRRACR